MCRYKITVYTIIRQIGLGQVYKSGIHEFLFYFCFRLKMNLILPLIVILQLLTKVAYSEECQPSNYIKLLLDY